MCSKEPMHRILRGFYQCKGNLSSPDSKGRYPFQILSSFQVVNHNLTIAILCCHLILWRLDQVASKRSLKHRRHCMVNCK
ncbi:hypothetical protein GDO78_006530 [Eleutherodactylus coqui]|uniref:Uncharacterized protein n=1 Tax=Eleutherodactylus coqui TaxID=57060 RepID=A0A8J6FNV6_ELECQ|nr:hypothetical protein GDO78_006530 [Eleutherodactylus coqui]